MRTVSRQDLGRRCVAELLEPRALLSATMHLAPELSGGELGETAAVVASNITVGPYVGGVDADSGKVFVRTAAAGAVKIEYSTTANFSQSSFTAAKQTAAASDFTSIQTISGLAPETRYYYRVYVDGQLQPQGVRSFETFPAAGVTRSFSFAVTADIINVGKNPNVGAPVYAALAADDPLFMLQIGDFDHRNPGSLAAMRTMHRQVLGPSTATGADFDKYIASNMPVFHVWDDHDYGANNADKTFAGRAAALQAFREYYATPTLPNLAGIWHSFGAGQVDVMMLDVRSQRDPASTADGPGKSMLDGDNIANGQKAWLKAALANSTATWKFIVSGVTFNPTTKPTDAWGAYATERNEIVNFIRSNNITGVIFVSGDLHSGGAIDNGANAGFPEISVPHTNLNTNQKGSGPVGAWSHGLISGINNPGYALITVTGSQVTLQVKGVDGAVKKSLTVGAGGGGSPGTSEWIVDDGTAGFATVGTWGVGKPAGTYQGDQRFSAKGTGADKATWTLAGLSAGSYEVFTRWAGSGTVNRASNAPYTIFDGATARGTVLVNQQVTPSSVTVGGVSWQRLGVFTVNSGTIKVTVSDKTNGYVFADALRVVRVAQASSAASSAELQSLNRLPATSPSVSYESRGLKLAPSPRAPIHVQPSFLTRGLYYKLAEDVVQQMHRVDESRRLVAYKSPDSDAARDRIFQGWAGLLDEYDWLSDQI